MHKFSKISLGILFIVSVLISGCSSTDNISPICQEEQVEADSHITEELEVIINTSFDFDAYDLEGTYFTSKEATQELTADYLREIGILLNDKYWWETVNPKATKLYLDFNFGSTPKSVTEVCATKCGEDGINGGFLISTYGKEYFKTDGSLGHELVHMIGYMHNFSSSLDDGICEWVNWQIGKGLEFSREPSWKFQDYFVAEYITAVKTKGLEDKFNAISEHIGTAEQGYYYGEGDELNSWYDFSHSFVEYIIDFYGIDKTKELILNGTSIDSYKDILGISYEELKQNWIDYIFSYETELTHEKIYERMLKKYEESQGTNDASVRIDELSPGDIVTSKLGNIEDYFVSYDIIEDDDIYKRILNKSYQINDNISLDQLTYIKLLHYNFNHEIQVGELIVNRDISKDIIEIFMELFNEEYELQSMYLIDNYWAGNGDDTDTASIEVNNSSAFCYREITNGGKLSNHALGMAIDINPQQNPYVSYKSGMAEWYHENANEYIDRLDIKAHMITQDDICYKLFTEHGFSWGGNWNSIKDYQHFEKY